MIKLVDDFNEKEKVEFGSLLAGQCFISDALGWAETIYQKGAANAESDGKDAQCIIGRYCGVRYKFEEYDKVTPVILIARRVK